MNRTRSLRPSQGGRFHAPVFPAQGVDALGFPIMSAAEQELAQERRRLVGCTAHALVPGPMLHDEVHYLILGVTERVERVDGVIRAYGADANGKRFDWVAKDVDPPLDPIAKARAYWEQMIARTERNPIPLYTPPPESTSWAIKEWPTPRPLQEYVSADVDALRAFVAPPKRNRPLVKVFRDELARGPVNLIRSTILDVVRIDRSRGMMRPLFRVTLTVAGEPLDYSVADFGLMEMCSSLQPNRDRRTAPTESALAGFVGLVVDVEFSRRPIRPGAETFVTHAKWSRAK